MVESMYHLRRIKFHSHVFNANNNNKNNANNSNGNGVANSNAISSTAAVASNNSSNNNVNDNNDACSAGNATNVVTTAINNKPAGIATKLLPLTDLEINDGDEPTKNPVLRANSTYILLDKATKIGRNPELVDVVLHSHVHSNMISRDHSEIFFENGEFFITDNSLNGTYVNDYRAPKNPNKQLLHEGDVIKFGHVNGAAISPGEHAPQESADFIFKFEQAIREHHYFGSRDKTTRERPGNMRAYMQINSDKVAPHDPYTQAPLPPSRTAYVMAQKAGTGDVANNGNNAAALLAQQSQQQNQMITQQSQQQNLKSTTAAKTTTPVAALVSLQQQQHAQQQLRHLTQPQQQHQHQLIAASSAAATAAAIVANQQQKQQHLTSAFSPQLPQQQQSQQQQTSVGIDEIAAQLRQFMAAANNPGASASTAAVAATTAAAAAAAASGQQDPLASLNPLLYLSRLHQNQQLYNGNIQAAAAAYLNPGVNLWSNVNFNAFRNALQPNSAEWQLNPQQRAALAANYSTAVSTTTTAAAAAAALQHQLRANSNAITSSSNSNATTIGECQLYAQQKQQSTQASGLLMSGTANCAITCLPSTSANTFSTSSNKVFATSTAPSSQPLLTAQLSAAMNASHRTPASSLINRNSSAPLLNNNNASNSSLHSSLTTPTSLNTAAATTCNTNSTSSSLAALLPTSLTANLTPQQQQELLAAAAAQQQQQHLLLQQQMKKDEDSNTMTHCASWPLNFASTSASTLSNMASSGLSTTTSHNSSSQLAHPVQQQQQHHHNPHHQHLPLSLASVFRQNGVPLYAASLSQGNAQQRIPALLAAAAAANINVAQVGKLSNGNDFYSSLLPTTSANNDLLAAVAAAAAVSSSNVQFSSSNINLSNNNSDRISSNVDAAISSAALPLKIPHQHNLQQNIQQQLLTSMPSSNSPSTIVAITTTTRLPPQSTPLSAPTKSTPLSVVVSSNIAGTASAAAGIGIAASNSSVAASAGSGSSTPSTCLISPNSSSTPSSTFHSFNTSKFSLSSGIVSLKDLEIKLSNSNSMQHQQHQQQLTSINSFAAKYFGPQQNHSNQKTGQDVVSRKISQNSQSNNESIKSDEAKSLFKLDGLAALKNAAALMNGEDSSCIINDDDNEKMTMDLEHLAATAKAANFDVSSLKHLKKTVVSVSGDTPSDTMPKIEGVKTMECDSSVPSPPKFSDSLLIAVNQDSYVKSEEQTSPPLSSPSRPCSYQSVPLSPPRAPCPKRAEESDVESRISEVLRRSPSIDSLSSVKRKNEKQCQTVISKKKTKNDANSPSFAKCSSNNADDLAQQTSGQEDNNKEELGEDKVTEGGKYAQNEIEKQEEHVVPTKTSKTSSSAGGTKRNEVERLLHDLTAGNCSWMYQASRQNANKRLVDSAIGVGVGAEKRRPLRLDERKKRELIRKKSHKLMRQISDESSDEDNNDNNGTSGAATAARRSSIASSSTITRKSSANTRKSNDEEEFTPTSLSPAGSADENEVDNLSEKPNAQNMRKKSSASKRRTSTTQQQCHGKTKRLLLEERKRNDGSKKLRLSALQDAKRDRNCALNKTKEKHKRKQNLSNNQRSVSPLSKKPLTGKCKSVKNKTSKHSTKIAARLSDAKTSLSDASTTDDDGSDSGDSLADRSSLRGTPMRNQRAGGTTKIELTGTTVQKHTETSRQSPVKKKTQKSSPETLLLLQKNNMGAKTTSKKAISAVTKRACAKIARMIDDNNGSGGGVVDEWNFHDPERSICAHVACCKPQDDNVNWAACDACDKWFHTLCALGSNVELSDTTDFRCGCRTTNGIAETVPPITITASSGKRK